MDFYSAELRLGIEVDGGQHYEPKIVQRDEFRTRQLSQEGVQIIRFGDGEILNNVEGVCLKILETAEKRKDSFPSPRSSPRRGEEN